MKNMRKLQGGKNCGRDPALSHFSKRHTVVT